MINAHKLLKRFEMFDFESRFVNRYKPKYSLYDLINDDLKNLPEGSFGKDFYNHLNQDKSSIDSLYKIYRNENDSKKVTQYKKDWCVVHDLQHFITGYDTSLVGEGLMFSFSLRHELRPTIIAIIIYYAVQQLFKRKGFIKSKYWINLVREANRLSKHTKWFMSIDWREKFAKPTEQVLKEIGVYEKPELWILSKGYINHHQRYKGEI